MPKREKVQAVPDEIIHEAILELAEAIKEDDLTTYQAWLYLAIEGAIADWQERFESDSGNS